MRIPQFTAEASISRPHPGHCAQPLRMDATGVVPSLPGAQACEWAANRCEQQPRSLACRLLKLCTGSIRSGGAGGNGGGADFVNFAQCAAFCNHDQTCMGLFC